MKIYVRKLVGLSMGLLALGFVGCNNNSFNDPARELISEKETSVNWSDTSKEISSYSANVSVYSMNNRKDTSFKLDSQYKLAVKMIDDNQYTRLDMLDQSPDGQYRSVVMNNNELIMFNTNTEEIQERVPVTSEAKDFVFLQDGIGFGKSNLDLVKREASRLAFDMSEDTGKSKITISLPSEYFSTEAEKRISTRITYDTLAETMNEVEIVDLKSNGSIETTTIEYVYQECDGNYIKIGMITTIDTKFEKLITTEKVDVPTFDSIEDIPEISEKELKKMQKEGNAFENTSIKFGNPADLSSVIKIVEVYEDVEVNKTNDSVFKLLF